MKEINSAVQLNEFVSSAPAGATVIIKLGAEWCGPCKAQEKIINNLLVSHPNILCGKIDIDAVPSVAVAVGVKSVPTLLFFRDNQIVKNISGVVKEDKILKMLEEET